MVNYPNTQIYLGARAAPNDVLQLTSYQTEDIVVTLLKTDGAGGGQIFAGGQILKPFSMPAQFGHNDVANRWYGWLPPDTGTTAHEGTTGAAMVIGGTGTGILAGNAGAARYAGQYGMLHYNSNAELATTGIVLEAAENAGQSWTLEFWIFRQAAAVSATIYMEANAAVTTYLAAVMQASGVMIVQQSGVTKWTAPAAIGLGAWHHVALVYSAGGATIQMFVDGVSAGAAAAYVRFGAWPGGNTWWNFNANGQAFVALGAVYQNVAFVADDALRHYTDLTTDTYDTSISSTPATLAKGAIVTVIFSNAQGMGYDAASSTIRLPLYPICRIDTFGGIYLADISIRQKEAA